ncbi:MAG: DNA-3-methyladenine glycosylase 2 family protein [Candidatus Pacebacteria bacterium CG10_big_fil_rev_8_21_14_0_10_56_10]|nr:MAG: DNA-3-methyladenine glycosylase 2 family protein [Candidatus Pacebacteria bacterium CG10_big_fil_rev_8_21_14_0_10_56_10]
MIKTPHMSSPIFSHFRRRDRLIYQVLTAMDDFNPLAPTHPPEEYFSELSSSIVGQQLSTTAAHTIYTRLVKLLAGDVTAARLLAADDQAMRDCGLSWAKVRSVKDLAAKVANHQLKLNRLTTMSDAQVIAELTKVKGIGQWTAEMFLIFALGREDIFSHGDLGLRRAMEGLYGLGQLPSPAQADQISTKWRPYRSYGCLALWHTLDNAPI